MDTHGRSLPPFPMLFQDRRFLVLDKPAGIPVHATGRGGANVEDAVRTWARAKAGPWLAHRLDTDTAGCLLIALRRAALHTAQAEFAAGRARKTYWAVVLGQPSGEEGEVDAPLARSEDGRRWRMAVRADGKGAVTAWRVLGTYRSNSAERTITWLELRPRTGRTHQVRAHCAALGYPVLGDAVYGGGAGRLHLLARALRLDLDPPVEATAAVPAHMRAALEACGYSAAFGTGSQP